MVERGAEPITDGEIVKTVCHVSIHIPCLVADLRCSKSVHGADVGVYRMHMIRNRIGYRIEALNLPRFVL